MTSTSAADSLPACASQPLGPGKFALVLLALFLCSYPEVLSLSQTFVYRDFGLFGAPLAQFSRESWLTGHPPLWNPYNNLGLPFLAQWNTMALYPPGALYLVFPVASGLAWFCLLHLYAAGLGMYFLARRWSGSDLGAALAGVAFCFSGLGFNCLLWPNNVAGLAWMPWILLLASRATAEGGRWLLATGLAAAMQILAGAPEIIIQTWIIAGMITLVPPPSRDGIPPRWPKRLLRLGLAGALASALAAAQLLPFLQLLAHSQRATGYSVDAWAMPWWGWGNFLVPLLHCYSWESGVYYQPDQFWISSYYLGAATFLLALYAGVKSPARPVRALGCLGILLLVLAMGQHAGLYPALVKTVPGAGIMRYPIKFAVGLTLLLPLLAAVGIAHLENETRTRRPCGRNTLLLLGVIGMALIAGLVALMKLAPQPFDEFGPASRNALERAGLLAAILAGLWGALAMRKASARAFLGLATVLCLWLDLNWHAPNQVLTAPVSVLSPDLARQRGQPALSPAQGRVMMSREAKQMMFTTLLTKPDADFLGKRLSAFSDCNLLDHLPKVDGFYSLYTAWQHDVVGAAYRTNGCPPNLADFLAITHATAKDDVFSWAPRPTALPLATAGQQPVFLEAEALKQRIVTGDWDPRREILLPLEARDRAQAKVGSPAAVAIKEFSPSVIQLEISNAAPAWAVLTETYYPNWRAYADGKPVRTWRANHAFLAAEIPAGTKELKWIYEDRAFHAGLGISALALALCGALWRRWRSAPSAAPECIRGNSH